MKYVQAINDLITEVDQMPKENFFYEGIKEKSLNVVVAQSKIGKTCKTENLSMTIAAGHDSYLGKKVWHGDNQRVMLVSLEEFYKARTQRNKAQMDFLDGIVGNTDWHSNVFAAKNDIPKYLETKKHWDQLLADIEEVNPALTVIDSLSRLHGTSSIEDSSTGIEVMKRLRNIIDKTGTTLLIVHHTSKMGSDPLTLSNMAGSRIIAQEADAIIGMNKTPSGKRYIKPLAYRYADDNSEMVQVFSRNSHHWLIAEGMVPEYKLLKEHDQRTDDTSSIKVMEFFSSYTADDPSVLVETKELMQTLVNTGVMSKPTLFKTLSRLTEEEFIQKHGKGQYTLPQTEV